MFLIDIYLDNYILLGDSRIVLSFKWQVTESSVGQSLLGEGDEETEELTDAGKTIGNQSCTWGRPGRK